MKNKLTYSWLVALVLAALACNASGTPTSVVGTPAPAATIPPVEIPATAIAPAEVAQYLAELPDWQSFSPLLDDRPPAPSGDDPVVAEPVTLSAPLKDEAGNVERDENGNPAGFEEVTYTCTTTPYTLTQTPQQIVMYNPDASILWPGVLIQGQSYAAGRGSLLSLPVAERAPLIVTIPDFFNEDPSRVVENPDLDSVTRAISSMVGNAYAEGLATPSTITFEMESYHGEADFAASFAVSGRYLGFEGSASGDYASSEAETTIAVHFYQQMFTVVVPPPQTPAAFFANSFTEARLQEQISLGRIGPDNLPVYLSEVVYGRMMMFTLTSTASEVEIRGTLNAAYNGIGGGAAASLSAAQRNVLQSSKIAITSYGGDAGATIAMIRSGDWSQYFTDEAPLTTARPLSYTFRNLDGSIAQVSESWNYNIRQCRARAANAGVFDLLPAQTTAALSLPVPYEALSGDMNGDGRLDLILNHKSPQANQIVVGLGNGDASFTFTSVAAHPETAAGGWNNYDTLVADVNGDGRADIVWNYTGQENRIYAGLANGDGGFQFLPAQEHPEQGWAAYQSFTGDVNGDGRADLIWVENAVTSRSAAGLANGDGTFSLAAPRQDYPAREWGDLYTVATGDIDGDGRTDLIWNLGGSPNRTYVALANGDGSFDASRPPLDRDFCCGELQLVADINGDGRDDLVWNNAPASRNTTYIALAEPDGVFDWLHPFMNHPAAEGEWHFYDVYSADVNGDGRDDIIWNDVHGTTNRLYVAIATAGGQFAFDFSRVPQAHPDVDQWSTATTLLGDVNGDRLQDIIWLFTGVSPKLVVGLAVP